ncbi:hypothetical protein [Seongchinamella sediminis]|uniref:hypothetical protein n=1 Tax=Seongchinamella sediminis TaxID=2283635 RepID=UPI001EF15FE3|nr:hypothetical protein [Seongchinamella sediminis]
MASPGGPTDTGEAVDTITARTRRGLAYLTANGVAGDPDRGIALLDESANAGEALAAAVAATVRATGLWGRPDTDMEVPKPSRHTGQ